MEGPPQVLAVGSLGSAERAFVLTAGGLEAGKSQGGDIWGEGLWLGISKTPAEDRLGDRASPGEGGGRDP